MDIYTKTILRFASNIPNAERLKSPDISITRRTAVCGSSMTVDLNIKNGNNTAMGVVNAFNNSNLTCIEVDDINYSAVNWTNIDSQTSFSTDCNNDCSGSAGIGELNTTTKQLIKIVDVLGRETPFKPNTPLLYIYNDGTVERKMIIEE